MNSVVSLSSELVRSSIDSKGILDTPPALADLLPVAVYACDSSGRIRWFNRRAAEMWGCSPLIAENAERFCGSYKLFWLDGSPVNSDETPMAQVLRTGKGIDGAEAIVERPDGSRIIAMVHIAPIHNSDGDLLGAINCFHETAGLRQAQQQRRDSERGFRDLLEALPVAIYTTDLDGKITFYNRAAAELWGHAPELESSYWCGSWRLFWPDGAHMAHDECPMAQAIKENRSICGAEAIAERPDGSRLWFAPYPTPLRDADGNPVGAVNMLVDITERKRNEKHLELLSRELDHRAKNMLAVVQSIVRLSKAETVSEFSDTLLGRIAALAHAHTLLSESRWEGADLMRLIEEEFAPYRIDGRPRADVQGPAISLNSSVAQPIAMALHELTTNAAKYGALSVPEGRVAIAWSRSPYGKLQLRWTEIDGPPVTAPLRRNFGTTLIELTVRDQLNGAVKFDWRPTGFACEIEVPAEAFRTAR